MNITLFSWKGCQRL